MVNIDKSPLEGRVAIVTGGNEGIGRGISLCLAEAGADVVIACRQIDLGDEVAKKIEAKGRKAIVISTDVTDNNQVVNMVDKTIEVFGKIDILVNNAGGGTGATFGSGYILDISERDWDATVTTNLKSVFLCSRAAVRIMQSQKNGSIINIASIFGEVPGPKMPAYSAAKAGVISFTKSAAREWAPFVRVNAIAPSLVVTDRILKYYGPEWVTQRSKDFPLKRLGRPEDIGNMVVYLACDAAEWITGAIMDVNGGER